MAKIQSPKKLRVEDFPSEYKDVIEKIANSYNSFTEEVYIQFNGNLDSSNINRQISEITVKTNATSQLIVQPQLKITINGRVRGLNVISANNAINPGIYPISAPFVSFSINGTILTILNVSGLQPNSEYRLVLELIV